MPPHIYTVSLTISVILTLATLHMTLGFSILFLYFAFMFIGNAMIFHALFRFMIFTRSNVWHLSIFLIFSFIWIFKYCIDFGFISRSFTIFAFMHGFSVYFIPVIAICLWHSQCKATRTKDLNKLIYLIIFLFLSREIFKFFSYYNLLYYIYNYLLFVSLLAIALSFYKLVTYFDLSKLTLIANVVPIFIYAYIIVSGKSVDWLLPPIFLVWIGFSFWHLSSLVIERLRLRNANELTIDERLRGNH